jgi:hypothetical protein
VNLKFTQGYALTGVSGLAGRTFSLNAPFDPDITGVGNQPVYYDQLSALYNKYRVVRAHWRIKMVSKTATNAGVIAAAPTPAVADTSFASVEELGEEPGASVKEFGSAGSPPAGISGSCSMAEIYGNSADCVHILDSYAAVNNARPSNEVYLACCVNTSGNTDTTQLMVEIVFETWFERRIMNDLSSSRRRHPRIIDVNATPQRVPSRQLAPDTSMSCDLSLPLRMASDSVPTNRTGCESCSACKSGIGSLGR